MKKIIIDLLIVAGVMLFFAICLIASSNNFDKKANACDQTYGYKCSYYQIRTFKN